MSEAWRRRASVSRLRPGGFLGGSIARAAVTLRAAVDDPSVRQRHEPAIHEARTALRKVAIDNERVAYFDVALFEASARERSWASALDGPVPDLPVGALDVQMKVAVRICPVDFRELAHQSNRFVRVVQRRERVVSRRCRGNADS